MKRRVRRGRPAGKKPAEEKSRPSEVEIIEAMRDGVGIADLKMRTKDVNKSCLKMFGYKKEELIGKPVVDLFVERERTVMMERAREDIEKGISRVSTYTAVNKAGKEFPVQTSVSVRKDENGKPIDYVAVIRDITELKRAEEEIKAKSQFLESLIEQSPLPTFVIDSEGICVMVNKAFLNAYNVPKKEMVLGRNALTEPANVRQGVVKYMKEALSGQIVETPEVDFISPYENKRTVTKSRLFPIFDATNKLTNVVVMHEDITELKRAEEERVKAEAERESEKKYRELVELLPEMVFELDTAGRVIFANQAAFSTFGYSQRDLGVSAIQMFVPKDRERAKKNIMRVLSGEKLGTNEYTALRKDGSTFSVIIHSSPIIRENKPVGLRGIIVDITEFKRAEEERLRRERVFRMSEDITGSIIRKFGVGITSEELGLKDILDQFSELAVYPPPRDLFNLLAAGTFVVLRREGVEARKKEVREFLAPLIQRALREIFVIAEEFGRDIPPEHKALEKALRKISAHRY